MMNPLALIEIALASQRAVAPTPVSICAMTVGIPGNVNPKFTPVVEDDCEVKVNDVDPRRDQLVKFVIDVVAAATEASSAAMSDAWLDTTLSVEASAASTCTARTGEEVVGPPVKVTPGSELGDS
jgi:hypothetical protein